MKNWIKPIKTTIKKYKALKKGITTGEYNDILDTGCILCKEAIKKNPETNKCYNCIYNQLFHKHCIKSKDFEIVYNLDDDFFWHFGHLINYQDNVSLSLNLGEILILIEEEELLKKLESRIEFLNNMLMEVRKHE